MINRAAHNKSRGYATAVLALCNLLSLDRVRKRCGNYDTGNMTSPTTRPSVARCPQVDSGRCHW